MFESGRRDIPSTLEERPSNRLLPLDLAIRRVVRAGHGSRGVKAEIVSLCRRARRDGISVETLVIDVHRMLNRHSAASRGEPWERELRQKLVCYVIAAYHRDGQPSVQE